MSGGPTQGVYEFSKYFKREEREREGVKTSENKKVNRNESRREVSDRTPE